MTTLVATDLDRTLIYSAAAAQAGAGTDGLVAVEQFEGHDASYMTRGAATVFAELYRRCVVVPVTTRTPDQLRRVTLPGPEPRYAIAANGGVLLVGGVPDPDWARRVERNLSTVAPLAEIWAHAGDVCRPEWTVKLRNAHDMFCYAVLHRSRIPSGMVAAETAWAASRGWQVSMQGRKLYWVPAPLTKSAAAAEIADRAGTSRTLAAGDSLLDADLLGTADAGILARHGELAASGWTAPNVQLTDGTGVHAGAEIVDWFAAATRDGT